MTCDFCGGDDPVHAPAYCPARAAEARRAAWVAFAAAQPWPSATMPRAQMEALLGRADAFLEEYDARVKDGRL